MRDEGGGTEDRAQLGMTFSCQKTGPKTLMREKSDEEKTKTGKGEDESDYKLFLNREPSKKGRTIRLEILSFKRN